MSANKNPIFSKQGDVQWALVSGANTAKDGTGGATPVFTADAEEGGYVQKMRFRPLGSNVASVARVFMNNGGSPETATNNALVDEVTLPAVTLSEVAAMVGTDIALNFALPPGYRLYVTLGTAVAAGYQVTVFGGRY